MITFFICKINPNHELSSAFVFLSRNKFFSCRVKLTSRCYVFCTRFFQYTIPIDLQRLFFNFLFHLLIEFINHCLFYYRFTNLSSNFLLFHLLAIIYCVTISCMKYTFSIRLERFRGLDFQYHFRL